MANRIKALGEIALCVNDMDAMRGFYRDVIGLELLRDSPNAPPSSGSQTGTRAILRCWPCSIVATGRATVPTEKGRHWTTSRSRFRSAITRRKRRGSKATASKFKPANTPGSTGAASTCATPREIRLNWFVTTTARIDPLPLV